MDPAPTLSPCGSPAGATAPGLPVAPAPRQPDEMHVLLLGLDPVAATVALLLADVGVCLLNVCDPSPVTAQDISQGPYPLSLVGAPREYALRRMLRSRWTRCVPLSAPELFCSSAIPTAVVLRCGSVAGPLPQDLLLQPTVEPADPHLPTVTVVTDGSRSITWPPSPWYRRPCRDCLVAAVAQAGELLHTNPPHGTLRLGAAHSPVQSAVTRVSTASELTASLLGRALDSPTAASAPGPNDVVLGVADPSAPDPGSIVLRAGLYRAHLPVRADCLCALDA